MYMGYAGKNHAAVSYTYEHIQSLKYTLYVSYECNYCVEMKKSHYLPFVKKIHENWET